MLVCVECEHSFDPADKRGSLSDEYGNRCPLCAYQLYQGSEAWAVRNGCQGIFCDTVTWSKSDAEASLQRYHQGDDDAKVVPVRVYEEPEDRISYREWIERQCR